MKGPDGKLAEPKLEGAPNAPRVASPYLTLEEAAAYLRIDEKTLRLRAKPRANGR